MPKISIMEKLKQVAIQVLWLPLSLSMWILTISPLLAILSFTSIMAPIMILMESEHLILKILGWIIVLHVFPGCFFCWVPNKLYKKIIFPKLKSFVPDKGYDYNVGESTTIVEHDVQREVRNSNGNVVGYISGKDYEVKHDNGDRHEMSQDEAAIGWFCIFLIFTRIISLIASIFAIFIPRMGVAIRHPKFEFQSSESLFIWLDIYIMQNVSKSKFVM